jgi:hypothetical protein
MSPDTPKTAYLFISSPFFTKTHITPIPRVTDEIYIFSQSAIGFSSKTAVPSPINLINLTFGKNTDISVPSPRTNFLMP